MRRFKTCKACDQFLRREAFPIDRTMVDGHKNTCKACVSWRQRQATPVAVPAEKTCAVCCNVKPAGAFTPDRTKRDGLYHHCRDCHRFKRKQKRDEPSVPQTLAEEYMMVGDLLVSNQALLNGDNDRNRRAAYGRRMETERKSRKHG